MESDWNMFEELLPGPRLHEPPVDGPELVELVILQACRNIER